MLNCICVRIILNISRECCYVDKDIAVSYNKVTTDCYRQWNNNRTDVIE